MKQMKLVLLAINPMDDYVGSLTSSLSQLAEVHLFAPERYKGMLGLATLHSFPTGNNKYEALRYFLNPFLARKIWNDIIDLNPSVIHLINGEGYPWSLLWLNFAEKAKIPMVVTVHDPEHHPGNLFETINAFFRRFSLPKAAKVHIHSDVFTQKIIDLGVKSNNVFVIPMGSIAKKYLPYKREGIKKELSVLFFGRFEKYKGLDFLVKTALTLKGEFQFIIAGSGILSKKLLKTINDNPDLFEFHNRWVSDIEIATFLQRSFVCVLPYSSATHSCHPLLAAAFGVPVVATTFGSFPKDIPLVNGILYQSGDTKAFIDALRLAKDRKPFYPVCYEYDNLKSRYFSFYEYAIDDSSKPSSMIKRL